MTSPARAAHLSTPLRSLLCAVLLAHGTRVLAQDSLYVPRTFRQAVARGTRRTDGRPGARYWQNHARYAIDITAAPPDRTIRGDERITYFNDSPDSLSQLVIKLFMNIHRPDAPRNVAFTSDYHTRGIEIDSVAVDGVSTAWTPGPAITWSALPLKAPLAPHDSIHLAFRWHYELARQPAREGVIDATTFYLAYFYPRVAVYDDIDGWDRMDFTDLQEFYSDFNDYDVRVHVPARFVVWGTGTLEHPEAVLQAPCLRRYTAALTSDTTIHVARRAELEAGAVTIAGGAQNTWRFTATNVPDVAFGLGDHYAWDAASVVVDAATRRRASVQAAYADTAVDFRAMVQMARHSLAFDARAWPGIPYPYDKLTLFQGGAGMEYPMMVNDESYADRAVADLVAAHEIAHTYMPFYMGIDETRYAFMDEGWATTFEYLINRENVGPDSATRVYRQFRVAPWATDPSALEDVAIVTPADLVRNPTYRNNAYGKASLGYLAVKDFLGDSTFRRALHAYMDRWHGKHPTPWDFFATFDDVARRDLRWFWNDWYFTSGYIDIAVQDVATTASGYAITLANVGGFAAPVDLVLTFADGSVDRLHESIGLWQPDLRRAVVAVRTRKTLRSVALSDGIWMDADHTNDRWSARPPGGP